MYICAVSVQFGRSDEVLGACQPINNQASYVPFLNELPLSVTPRSSPPYMHPLFTLLHYLLHSFSCICPIILCLASCAFTLLIFSGSAVFIFPLSCCSALAYSLPLNKKTKQKSQGDNIVTVLQIMESGTSIYISFRPEG